MHLRASADDWLAWAADDGIHAWVIDYLTDRPDHLLVARPRTEEPFSTPRGWHMLSDALHSYGDEVDEETLEVLTGRYAHPGARAAFARTSRRSGTLRPGGDRQGRRRLADPAARPRPALLPGRDVPGPAGQGPAGPKEGARPAMRASSPTGPRRMLVELAEISLSARSW